MFEETNLEEVYPPEVGKTYLVYFNNEVRLAKVLAFLDLKVPVKYQNQGFMAPTTIRVLDIVTNSVRLYPSNPKSNIFARFFKVKTNA